MNSAPSFYQITERYPDEASAIRYFEERRWPKGVICARCRSKNVLRGKQEKRRRQLWYCHACDAQFSVTSGTIMEATKLPLRKWLLAFHFMGASKKGTAQDRLGIELPEERAGGDAAPGRIKGRKALEDGCERRDLLVRGAVRAGAGQERVTASGPDQGGATGDPDVEGAMREVRRS